MKPLITVALAAIVKSVTRCPGDPLLQASATFAVCRTQDKREQRAIQQGHLGLLHWLLHMIYVDFRACKSMFAYEKREQYVHWVKQTLPELF